MIPSAPSLRTAPGRLSFWGHPGMTEPSQAIPAPLGDRVLQALGDEALSAPTLAYRVDGKELYVLEALRCLAGQGLVEAIAPPPAEGARFQKWRRVEA